MKALRMLLLAVSVVGLLVVSCGPTATPQPQPQPATPQPQILKETVVVTQTAKETVIVPQVVTATAAPAGSEVVTIRFMGWAGTEESTAGAWKKMVELFEQEHPNIKIEFVPTAAGGANLVNFLLAVSSGNAPDLAQEHAEELPALVQPGALVPLEKLAHPEVINGLVDTAVQAATMPDGHLYGLPWAPINRQAYWNVTLAKKAGLDVKNLPINLPDFEKAMHAIAALGTDQAGNKIYGLARWNNSHWLTGVEFERWLWMWNTGILDPTVKKVIVDQPPALETVKWLKSCVDSGACTKNSWVQDNYNLFVQDRVGVVVDGSNVRGVFRLSSGKGEAYDANVAMTPPPYYKNGVPQGDLWPHVVVLSKQSKHPQEALQFAEFLVSDPRAKDIYYEMGTMLPLWNASIAQPKYQQDPFVTGYLNQVKNDKKPQLSNFASFAEAEGFVAASINKIENLGADPQTELKNLAGNLRILLGLEQ